MRILLVEDDISLCEAIAFHLEKAGYDVNCCHNGLEVELWLGQYPHDLVILDRLLPGADGISILKQMRQQKDYTPVLMVTALDGIGDRVCGLDSGADDYLVKPFAVEELLARVRSLARRPVNYESGEILEFAGLSLDVERHIVQSGQKSIIISKRESQLLEVLIRNPQQIIPRAALFSKVWGADAPVEDGNLDNYVHFLRKRLKSLGISLQIKTIRSVGYRLEKI